MENFDCSDCGRTFLKKNALYKHINGWSGNVPCIRRNDVKVRNRYNQDFFKQNSAGWQCDDCGTVVLDQRNHPKVHKFQDQGNTYMNGVLLPRKSLTYTEVTKKTLKDVRLFLLNSSATTEGSQGQSGADTSGPSSVAQGETSSPTVAVEPQAQPQTNTFPILKIDDDAGNVRFGCNECGFYTQEIQLTKEGAKIAWEQLVGKSDGNHHNAIFDHPAEDSYPESFRTAMAEGRYSDALKQINKGKFFLPYEAPESHDVLSIRRYGNPGL